MITIETRARLMAARDDVFRAGDGHPSMDLARVAAHIDHALQALCPHLPVTWQTRPDEHGRSLTTCYACGMFWYNHEGDPPHVPYGVSRERAVYMASLEKRLEARTMEHGFAYVTPLEGKRLRANGQYQPGHTIHRFSTSSEDQSDMTQEALAQESDFENEGAPARKMVEDLAT